MFIILLKIELKMNKIFFSSDKKSGIFKNSYKYLYIVIIYGE